MEEKAARAYDLAALKYWGPSTHINFPVILFFLLILFSFHFFLFFTVIRTCLTAMVKLGNKPLL